MDRHRFSSNTNARPIVTWLGGTAMIAGLLIGALPGCNDKPDVPPVILPEPATKMSLPATRPTTQELQTAARKVIKLGSFPLTMEVPPTWKIEAIGSGVWLEGETPHGDARIQLAAQGASLKLEAVIAMDKGARAKAASQPTSLEVSPLKPLNNAGTVQKMEKREILRHLPITLENGSVDYVDRVDWSILVFVPQDRGFNIDLLSFSGLSLEQYQQDREFLEHIIRSMQYQSIPGAALD